VVAILREAVPRWPRRGVAAGRDEAPRLGGRSRGLGPRWRRCVDGR